jgi:hypothetical protein
MELVYLSVYKCSSKQCYVKIILTIYGPTLDVYDDDGFLKSIINCKFWIPPDSENKAKNEISKFIYPSFIYPIQNSTDIVRRINRHLLVKIGKNMPLLDNVCSYCFYLCPNNTADL